MSPSSSGCNVSNSERDSSGATTVNDGFSVVAAISVTQRFSTLGNSASCCVRENRWTSSTNKTVSAPPVARCRRASSITARTSYTPAATAEISTKRRSAALATKYASVVFTVPGGHHYTTEAGPSGEPASCAATTRRSGEQDVKRSCCPTISSRL